MKRRYHNINQMMMDFSFDPGKIASVEGGQETLSDFERKLRLSIREALEDCGKRQHDPLDRYEVAARMSRNLQRDISKTHIDNWTALSSVTRRIHADSLVALCQVMGDWQPFHTFVESCGFKALSPTDAACAEFGALTAVRGEIDSRLKETRAKMETPELLEGLLNRALSGKAKP